MLVVNAAAATARRLQMNFAMGIVSPCCRAEGALDAQRARFALDAAQVGTWDYHPDTGELYWDARSHEIFGLPPDAAVTYDDFVSAIHPADRPYVLERIARTIDKSDDYRVEYRIVGVTDGAVRWVSVRGRVIARDAGGRATRFIGTVLDITERKALDLARETFMGVVGHDLRTPLGAIATGAKLLLQSEDLNARDRAVAARIASSADRMGRILQDLLDLTKSRLGGGLQIARSASNMGEICRKVVDELAVAHGGRRLSVELEGDLAGHWDADRVMQALSNLVGNAIRHGEDPIFVRARSSPEFVIVEVQNNGRPIAPDKLGAIFEPFERGLEAPAKSGIGLGLYIASEITRAHGGTIGVVSDERCTVFTTLWPARG